MAIRLWSVVGPALQTHRSLRSSPATPCDYTRYDGIAAGRPLRTALACCLSARGDAYRQPANKQKGQRGHARNLLARASRPERSAGPGSRARQKHSDFLRRAIAILLTFSLNFKKVKKMRHYFNRERRRRRRKRGFINEEGAHKRRPARDKCAALLFRKTHWSLHQNAAAAN